MKQGVTMPGVARQRVTSILEICLHITFMEFHDYLLRNLSLPGRTTYSNSIDLCTIVAHQRETARAEAVAHWAEM